MSVRFERDVENVLRDGTRLRANVFRPDAEGQFPVLLVRIPYGKDSIFNYNLANPLQLAEAGYIVAVQDVRGTFSSEGSLSGFQQEFEDGYDAVEWASQLPGSNGKVGMFGGSYFAWTQLSAAAMRHPALKTVVPAMPVTDARAANRRGGAVEWGVYAGWTLSMMPDQLLRTAARNPDMPRQFGRLIHAIDHMTETVYPELPVAQLTAVRQTDLVPAYLAYIDKELDDAQWGVETVETRYADMTVSAYVIGGWYDIFLRNALVAYETLRETGHRTRLLIGPWTHTGRLMNFVGELDFGVAANGSTLDLKYDMTELHRRWFDAELKDTQPAAEVDLPIHIFVMGENRWRSVSQWPLLETTYVPYYLHSGGQANSVSGDGSLSAAPPKVEQADRYEYDPGNPVPTIGGHTLMAPALPAGPYDQATVEMRSDVLVYTSKVFTEAVEVTGPVTAKLWVSSDAVDTDFVVRLADVHPDGRSIPLADGILRMRNRDGEQTASWMEPGEVYAITIDCWATSNVFLPGHRIRVHVTSSSFPRWNRNLNTGASNETTAQYRSARQSIYHDVERPSHIVLPIMQR